MKRKKWIIAALASMSLVFGFLGFTLNAQADVASFFSMDGELNACYFVGETLSIPSAKFVVDGEDIQADTIINGPDNRAYRARDTIELTVPGEYELEYRAYSSGELLSEKRSFSVKNTIYTFSGEKNSSFEYGLDSSAYQTEIMGLRTSIGMDSVFHYNEIFNVNELSQSQPIIEFFTLPKMLGNYDARIILVRLTDVYDSGNYVEVAFRRWAGLDDWASNVTYLSASTNGQNWVGVEGSKLHTDSTYAGLPVYVSMIGESIYDDNGVRRVENVVGKQNMGFYLSGTDVVATVNGKAYGTVCSLDNPSYFSHTWKGFTTGEVTLTIEALEYNVSSEMNLMITKLGGKSMRENGELTDSIPPVIEIDMQGEETVVTAVVDTPYPLYPATAYDLYSKNCRITSAVYGSYGTTNQFDVEIIDGCFTPRREGAYTIEYKARDGYGNEEVKTLRVNAVSKKNELNIRFEEEQTEGKVGEYISIASAQADGGHGKKNVEISVKKGNVSYTVQNGTFYPEESGTYTVIYTATDRLGFSVSDGYTVAVAKADKPIFLTKPVLPEYFIIGKKYVLPKAYATDYNDQKKQIEAEIRILDATGEHIYDASEAYVVPENTKTVKITYTALNAQETYTKNTVDVRASEKEIDLTKYFATENLSLTAQNRYMEFTTISKVGTAKFVNALYADGFSSEFHVDKATMGGLKKITFTLSDVETGETLALGFDGKSLFLNGAEVSLKPTATFSNGTLFSFKYRINKTIELDTAGTVRITDYVDFVGFDSGKVFLEISVEGKNGTFCLETINGQRFNNATADNIRPEVILENVIVPVVKLGETVTISKALCIDVLDPFVNGNVSVSFGKNYVQSVDGAELKNQDLSRDWQFVANAYGDYIVTYVATDGAGRKQQYNYIVTVLDSGLPVITVNGSVKSSVALGEAVELPSATVTDDVDGDIVCKVFVFGPDSSVRFPAETFTPNKKGVYRICYTAVDKAGNVSTVEFTLEVK